MHTNALISEKSPYLQQHAHNPVAWLPWGEAAFKRARNEDKPIFLSIGYSTCHWCHVMAHESFESEQIADLLNQYFIPIKVDREERPDVDRIYMLYVQAATGSGGWPMSVWLTPDLKPFFGGTYFPPDSRYGRPGFADLLQQLAQAWMQQRAKVSESSERIVAQLRSHTASAMNAAEPDGKILDDAFSQFRRAFDAEWGGFGGAPKFPRPVSLNFLVRYHALSKSDEALEMVEKTLLEMAAGGMHDQLGGGFHRYSVDQRWFVPHFEKMLYDQAQLAVAYLEAFQITGQEVFARVARDVFSYVLNDMTNKEGGFYSAEDADSADPEDPGHSGEGAFYVWKQSEVESLLGKSDAAFFCMRYGIQPNGNVEEDPQGEFGGRNILFEAASTEEIGTRFGVSEESVGVILERSRKTLLAARNERPRPHLDSKVLSAWNGLMITALVRGYCVLGESEYLDAAERCARFLHTTMFRREEGTLFRRSSDGEAGIDGFLDDYAFTAQALLDLFEATSESTYLKQALALVQRGVQKFADTEGGGFFSTDRNAPDLLLRIKDDYDGAEPSGNSILTDVLLRLAHVTGDEELAKHATQSLRWFTPKLAAQPTAAPLMLVALQRWLTVPEQVVIRCLENSARVRALVKDYRRSFAPSRLVLAIDDATAERLRWIAPFISGLERKGAITIYECRNLACDLPTILN